MAVEAKRAWVALLCASSVACHALDVIDVPATIIDGDSDAGTGDHDGNALGYVDAVTTDAPLAWYRFTRADAQGSPRKALDASGHGFDGVYGSAARAGAPGALHADADTAAFVIDAGTGSITLPIGARMDGNWTIEAWVNLPSLAIDDFGAIYLDDDATTHGFAFGIDSGLHPALRSLTGGASVVSDATVDLGVWHHVAAVADGGAATIYVDGVVHGSGPFAATTSGAAPSLGGLDVGAIDAFMDEVALYDRPLTSDRLGAHVAAGSTGTPSACSLAQSAARVVTGGGNILEDLDFTPTSGPAIDVQGADGAIVRRVRITLDGGTAIRIASANDVVLEDVEIIYTSATAPADSVAIVVDTAARLTVQRLRIRGASSGVVLDASPNAALRYVEGVDFSGTVANAALVRFGPGSANGVLDGFSLGNGDGSPSRIGNVVAIATANVTVRHGVVRGNVDPAGAGVSITHTAATVTEALVEDVEIVGVNDNCFALSPGITTTFRRVGCGPTLCQDQGRGAPSSGGQGWLVGGRSSELRLKDSRFTNLCGAALSNTAPFLEQDLVAGTFPIRPLLQQAFCW